MRDARPRQATPPPTARKACVARPAAVAVRLDRVRSPPDPGTSGPVVLHGGRQGLAQAAGVVLLRRHMNLPLVLAPFGWPLPGWA